MDFQVQTHTRGVENLDWLASAKQLYKHPATIYTGFLTEATHYPNGYLRPGLALGLLTAGVGSGFWTPWVEDGGAPNNGEETLGAVIFSGFEIRRDQAGALVSNRTVGSILLPEDGHRLIVSKLPAGLLDDDSTPNTPTAAELESAGFSVMPE